jgi:hypothetical protein
MLENLLIGIVAILFGLVLCFSGYGFWRFALVISGFLLGYQIGAGLVAPEQWFLAIILGAIFAIVVSGLAYFFWSFSVIIGGAVLGGTIGVTLATAIGFNEQGIFAFVFSVIGGLIFAVLAALFKDLFVLVAMAVAGASTVLFGIATILPFLTFISQPESAIATIISVVLVAVLASAGTAFQLNMYRARFTNEYYFEQKAV